MRYLSAFSGIEAATAAWHGLGWHPVGFMEIEKFPCKVLAHHYPSIPNFGDITKVTEAQIKALGHVDVFVFGSPCQDLSVAGKRKGLEGERSGLFFDAMRIIGWLRKHCGLRWAVWENVPGAFSSNKGADFAVVVDALSGDAGTAAPPKGWGTEGAALGPEALVEWATLDAQWFGVAQRRRRVFAVADFGDWSSRPPILLERDSMRGDTAPSRESGESVARGIEIGPSGGCFTDVNPTLDTRCKDGPIRNQLSGAVACQSVRVSTLCMPHGQGGTEISDDGAPPLSCNSEAPSVAQCFGGDVARTLSARYDLSLCVDRGADVVFAPEVAGTMKSCAKSGGWSNSVDHAAAGYMVPVLPFDTTQITRAASRSNPKTGDPCHTLAAGAHAPVIALSVALRGREGGATAELGGEVAGALRASSGGGDKAHVLAFSSKDFGVDATNDLSPTLRAIGHGESHANGGGQMAVCYTLQHAQIGRKDEAGPQGKGWQADVAFTQDSRSCADVVCYGFNSNAQVDQLRLTDGLSETLTCSQNSAALLPTMQVRRLTPLECERLQGFPGNYTLLPGVKADGPRYKALGNSMAVPVMRWIGLQIHLAMGRV